MAKSLYDEWDDTTRAIEQQTEARPLVGSFQDPRVRLPESELDSIFADKSPYNDPALFEAMQGATTPIPPINITPSPEDNEAYAASQLDSILNPVGQDTNKLIKPNAILMPEEQVLADADSDSGQGMDALVAKGVARAKVSPSPEESAISVEPVVSMDDEEMRQALSERRHDMAVAGFLRGINQMGAGYARTDPTTDFLKDYENAANAKVGDIKALRESSKERMLLNEEKQMHDPRSMASQMQRKAMRDMLGRIGYSSLAAKINDNMSAKQVQSLMGNINIQNLMTQHESLENRKATMKMSTEAKHEAKLEKIDEKERKELNDLNKLISPELLRQQAGFGKQYAIDTHADRIKALVEGQSPDKVTNQQLFELAKSLDSMLSQGAGTIAGTEHLLPKGWKTKLAYASEVAANQPIGAGQGKYVTQILHGVEREQRVAKEKIYKSIKALASSHKDVIKKHPAIWKDMLTERGYDPDAFFEGSTPTMAPKKQADFNDLGFKEQ